MTYVRINKNDPDFKPKPGDHWVTVTEERSIGGAYFAVEMWFNPDMGGFPEPFDKGVGRYATQAQAAEEAVMMADEQEMPCVLSPELWQLMKHKGLVS